jgi:hypothetical protein
LLTVATGPARSRFAVASSAARSQELPWILSIEVKDVAAQALAMRARQFPPDFTAAQALQSTAGRLGMWSVHNSPALSSGAGGREYLLRLGDSLQGKAAKRVERRVDGSGEGGGAQKRPFQLLGQTFAPADQIDRRAEHGEIEAIGAAYVA